MSHFRRLGPPHNSNRYSFLILSITFCTIYGDIVDIFIPKDCCTDDSRGFALVCYKYANEAQKVVEHLDGRVIDGRKFTIQFTKYGPNAKRINKGRIVESAPRSKRSHSPRRKYHFEFCF
ncbi:hypothetical protein AAHE18_06G169000 [Arachis hypogaea]